MSAISKAVPGPWRATAVGDTWSVHPGEAGPGRFEVCRVWVPGYHPEGIDAARTEAEHTARLIAAAPALAEALRYAVAGLEAVGFGQLDERGDDVEISGADCVEACAELFEELRSRLAAIELARAAVAAARSAIDAAGGGREAAAMMAARDRLMRAGMAADRATAYGWRAAGMMLGIVYRQTTDAEAAGELAGLMFAAGAVAPVRDLTPGELAATRGGANG